MNETLTLTDPPPHARGYLRSLVRQDIRKMRRSLPKLAAKFPGGDISRAEERLAYAEAVYAALATGDERRTVGPRGQPGATEGATQMPETAGNDRQAPPPKSGDFQV